MLNSIQLFAALDSRPKSTLLPQDVEETIEHFAHKIVTLRLEPVALFFLESHLPVLTLLHSTLLAFEPLVTPFFGLERVKRFQLLLSERSYLAELITRTRKYSLAQGQQRPENKATVN